MSVLTIEKILECRRLLGPPPPKRGFYSHQHFMSDRAFTFQVPDGEIFTIARASFWRSAVLTSTTPDWTVTPFWPLGIEVIDLDANPTERKRVFEALSTIYRGAV